jgi:uncharacterized protein (TIGR00297 family)
VVFSAATCRAGFLTLSGSVAGGLFAFSLLAFGGAAWAIPAFTFFFLSSLLSKIRSRRKMVAEAHYEKGSVRDAGQVLANGGVGWALLLIHALQPAPVLYWGFVGAFAAAAADTWATEIGALSPSSPRMVTTLRRVAAGTSGGVSAYGLGGAVAGSLTVWLAALPFEPGIDLDSLLAIAGGGVAGSLVDSLLGATLQVQYVDAATGGLTERGGMKGTLNLQVRGVRWIRNDVVNLICTLAGAGFAALIYTVR